MRQPQPEIHGPYKLEAYEKSIDLLARGFTKEAAARKLKITSETIREWERQPGYTEKLAAAKAAVNREWAAALRSRVPKTLTAVDKALAGKATNAAGMMKAVDFVWKYAGLSQEEKPTGETVEVEFGEVKPPVSAPASPALPGPALPAGQPPGPRVPGPACVPEAPKTTPPPAQKSADKA